MNTTATHWRTPTLILIVGCIILISVVLSLALSKKGDDLSGESS